MEHNNTYNRDYLIQLDEMRNAINIANSPSVLEALSIVINPVIQQMYQTANSLLPVIEPLQPMIEQYQQMTSLFTEAVYPLINLYPHENLYASLQQLNEILSGYNFLYCYPENMEDEEVAENKKLNEIITTEIFTSKSKDNIDEEIDKKDSAIITLSPINDKVLKYLSENPEALYQLKGREFEYVMAEIYNKLGYKVEVTKASRDGGKDIIIRKPEILGDFIYYVECKKYAANRHVGVGIVKELDSVINMDKINGGIIATTSYFTKDAKDLILDNKWDFRIKLHDYNVIKELLNRVA